MYACPFNVDDLTARSGCNQEIPKEMLQCVDMLPIVTAEQHGSHIPTGVINIQFYGYAIYLLVLIKFLYFALEDYFISKTMTVFVGNSVYSHGRGKI